MPPTTAAARSAPVEVMTRAVNVEALKPWSTVVIWYCSMPRARSGLGHLAGDHVEVVGRVAQVGVGVDGLLAVVQAVEGGQRGRHDGTDLHGVVAQLLGGDVERRLEVEGRADERDDRAQAVEGQEALGRLGDGRELSGDRRRQHPVGHDLGLEGLPLGRRGQLALEHQVPDVLQRPLLGQVRGRVLAVVVEALLAPDVAHRRLGHDHPGQALGGLHVPRVGDRLDGRDLQQVPQRDDADDAVVAVDDGDVAVAVLGQPLEGLADGHVGADGCRVGGHPLGHLGGPGRVARRREADQVPLGEDADGAPHAVDHHDRTHGRLVHAGRGLGHGVGGFGGDDR